MSKKNNQEQNAFVTFTEVQNLSRFDGIYDDSSMLWDQDNQILGQGNNSIGQGNNFTTSKISVGKN